MSIRLYIIALLAPAFVGCASITGTTGQSVSVQTMSQEGVEVKGAKCDMTNSKGKWFVTSPGSVNITRSNDNLVVQCRKEPYEIGTGSIVSETKGAMFGNIIFGGGIGAIVDHNTGAAYEYPSFFKIIMGAAHGAVAAINEVVTPSSATTAAQTSKNDNSAFEQLESLKRLLDKGVISQAEFDAKKAIVLKQI